MQNLKPLRGRVFIKPRRDDGGSKILWTPDQNPRAVKIHRGEVLQMNAIDEPGFTVGDEVLFTWEHLEKQWTFDDFVAVPQHCVHAVVEELPRVLPDEIVVETIQNEAPHPW